MTRHYTYKHAAVNRGCWWTSVTLLPRDLVSQHPLHCQTPEHIGGQRAGLTKLVLPGVIRPKLPTGATQVVSAPSSDLGKALGNPQLQPILQAACLLERVQISLIKHINLKLTICACFTKRLGEKNVREKNLI